MDCVDLHRVSRLEIVNHISTGLLVSMVEDVIFWVHIPFDLMDFVSSVWTVGGHHDRSLELSVHEIHVVSLQSVLDKGETVVNRKEFGNVVDDQIETSLENPGGSEETRPSLHLILEHFCLSWHEEPRVASDLPQL